MIKAIVVGITRYPSLRSGVLQNGDVPGAVDDAISFRDWLRTDRGLDEAEISLHLSPADGHPGAKPATDGAAVAKPAAADTKPAAAATKPAATAAKPPIKN